MEYKGKTVAALELDFLHDGLPAMKLKAKWEGPKEETFWAKKPSLPTVFPRKCNPRFSREGSLHPAGSLEYPLEGRVGAPLRPRSAAATLVKPFVGAEAKGPGDAAVIWLAPHGGEEKAGLYFCGLQPKLSRFDAYLSAQSALDEAVRNAVATGGDPDTMAVIDNFLLAGSSALEKNPDAEHKLAQSCAPIKALRSRKLYGTPFVSGKDSMKNDFIGKSASEKTCRSACPYGAGNGHGQGARRYENQHFGFPESGRRRLPSRPLPRHLGGSELEDAFDLPDGVLRTAPPVRGEENLRLYRTLHRAILSGLIRSAHDCSEGGMMVALAESAIGGNLGVQAEVDSFEEELKISAGISPNFSTTKLPAASWFPWRPRRKKISASSSRAKRWCASGQRCPICALYAPRPRDRDVPVRDAKKAWRGEK